MSDRRNDSLCTTSARGGMGGAMQGRDWLRCGTAQARVQRNAILDCDDALAASCAKSLATTMHRFLVFIPALLLLLLGGCRDQKVTSYRIPKERDAESPGATSNASTN